MNEEETLVEWDWPPDEACKICREKRLDGTLDEFMEKQRCPFRPLF